MDRAIIAGIDNGHENFEYKMSELAALAKAATISPELTITQKLDKPVSASYFGSGKLIELKNAAEAKEANDLIVNDELTPTQLRNIEDETGLTVIDRTALILEIFARRAHTREAKLQVQIASLQYRLPRLRTSSLNRFDQQTAGSSGGGFTSRGAGETQMELNRRTIQNQITHLRHQLKEVEQEEQTKRKARDSSGIKTVALVGYTNAGKSTTMNGLLRLTGEPKEKQVFEKNMLFATLDTSVRKVQFDDNKEILLSDTVGFVSSLPHQLVEAFKTTLAEAAQADLLVQVIDVSDPHAKEMVKTTEETLREIGVTGIPMIYAFNKADMEPQLRYPEIAGDQITYSARDDDSLKLLIKMVKDKLFADFMTKTYLIPFDQGRYLEQLNSNSSVLKTDYTADGTVITAEVSPTTASILQKFENS
ncbi:GTP-binding protein [Ligilactobacillus acidipiscis DSM 15836]|uniref:GTPase HflX n=1 Tax=Ligilactobacillus acidipiscis DSM 15836 TaxID=1423716 RepID=A0ABR5PIY0_9LACO|nr:GTPase HflX [Ligilactobacillus acidipiscis]KRM26168.1 GTP-binding protein [Ligilactobacillus acidipiscis DSM 15836]GAW64512.1 GTP-binding protein [Ligilactobacillus acidipiscis]GEN20501.1 GTPase HflX [Ligilactobacillus acidipiscis]